VEKEQSERYHVLLIVLYDRDERSTITRPQVHFVEFWDHLTGYIIFTADAQNLFFQCGKAQGREMVIPSPAAEMEYIEMGYSCQRAHAIICEPV
jgi:hypothetical protein